MYKLLLSVVAVLLLSNCGLPASERVYKVSGPTMGTLYHISWVDQQDRTSQVKSHIDLRLQDINKIMSTYDSASELSRINQSTMWPVQQRISTDLSDVLAKALQVTQQSSGAFDITVGPLVNLWGFGPDGSPDRVPEDDLLEEVLTSVGSDVVTLSGQSLFISEKRYLDLSAIAKGWAVDDISLLLESYGIENYLVEIGGEIKTAGVKPQKVSWKVAIERPDVHLQQTAHRVFSPGNRALATSGDYRNFFVENGVRYSHTISPVNGFPVEHELASVTVVNNSAAMADAWATALNVAGPADGMRLAETLELGVYMIVRDQHGNLSERTSTTFNEWFPEFLDQIP